MLDKKFLKKLNVIFCIYLFIWVLRRFQHYTGHITTGSWKGRGNQYIEFARVVYCKLPTNGKQLPAFPLKAVTEIESPPQRWEARVLPLCHRGPLLYFVRHAIILYLGKLVNVAEISVIAVTAQILVQAANLSHTLYIQATYMDTFLIFLW